MKKLSVLFTLFTLSLITSAQKADIHVPAGQRVEIDYPDYERYSVNIKTAGLHEVEVAVVSKKTGKQVRGFGLGSAGNADVQVELENKLVVYNLAEKEVMIKLSVSELSPEPEARTETYIGFTLRNGSMKAIPLIIPTVMNPNLSPMSNSRVDLKIGQEILFREKGKNYVLLTVDENVLNGDVIEVSALLKERRKELRLKIKE